MTHRPEKYILALLYALLALWVQLEEMVSDLHYLYHQDDTRVNTPIRCAQHWTGLDSRPVHVPFMVENVVLGRIYLQLYWPVWSQVVLDSISHCGDFVKDHVYSCNSRMSKYCKIHA